MAKSSYLSGAWKRLAWLGVIFAVFIGGNALAVWQNGGSWVPKLALDLQGGTQIILAPQLAESQTVTDEQLSQAVSIIRQRVDAGGVSEAEVTTQGGTNIVVSIPGTPDQATLDRIRSSAKLEFRPVLRSEIIAEGAPAPEPLPEVEVPDRVPENASDLAWVTPDVDQRFTSRSCSELDQ